MLEKPAKSIDVNDSHDDIRVEDDISSRYTPDREQAFNTSNTVEKEFLKKNLTSILIWKKSNYILLL